MNIHLRFGDFEMSTFGLAFLVALTAGFWYFTIYERPITNEDSPHTSVVAFGDSLIYGMGSQKKGGFVTLLEEDLGIDIVNLGVSGDTTQQAWARIDQVLRHKPKVVIISLGGNDFLKRSSRADTSGRLERIVSKLHANDSAVILLGVPGYWNMHRDIARDHNTGYVSNILSDLLGKNEYMFDSVHPNDAGYREIANRVRPVLERVLK